MMVKIYFFVLLYVFTMVKQASSTEGVFLVGPAGGPLRPWCGKCHKFLKSETAEHDCTPIDLRQVRRSKAASGGGKKRTPKLTPRKQEILKKVLDYAAVGKVMGPYDAKLRNASSKEGKAKAAAAYCRAFQKAVKSNRFDKEYQRLYHKFVK